MKVVIKTLSEWYSPFKYPARHEVKLKDVLYGINVFNTTKFFVNAKKFAVVTSACASIIVGLISILVLKVPLLVCVALATSTYVTLVPALYTSYVRTVVSYRTSVKREYIERDFYGLLVHLYGLCLAGVRVTDAIETILESDLNKYVKEEIAKVVFGVKLENLSLKEALLKVAITTPSKQLSDFLKGLAGEVETRQNPASFIRERLLLFNVERRVYLTEYLSKLEVLSQTYLTIIVLTVLIVLVASVTPLQQTFSPILLKTMIYLALPLSVIVFSILSSSYSPEKEIKKPYGSLSQVGIASIFICLYSSVLLNSALNVDYRLPMLIATIPTAVIIAFYVERQLSHESEVDSAIPSFLSRLSNLIETQSLSKALLLLSRTETTALREYLKDVALKIVEGVPTSEAIRRGFYVKGSTLLLRTIGLVLSRVCVYTNKLSEVILSLIEEFHRYSEYRKRRSAIVNTVGVVTFVTFVLVLGLTLLINNYYLPVLVSISPKHPVSHVFSSPNLANLVTYKVRAMQAKSLLVDTIIVLTVIVPLSIAIIDGDLRKFFRHYILCCLASITTLYIITFNIPLKFS